MGTFEGKVALVSGATGGFGRRTAERLAAAGAKLVLTDLAADRLAELAGTLGTEVATIAGSVTDEDLHKSAVELAIERFGALDIAVNNAGIVHDLARLPDTPTDVARRVLEIDLLGVFMAMKYQLAVMDRQFRANGAGGAIVNIASVAGIAGAPMLAVYAAAKHGVVGLTRSAAAEYARRGIRVNAVCPSFARTAMVTDSIAVAPAGAEDAAIADLVRGVPMRRLAEVDEVVEVILFAADPANGFMTGQALACDGGITAV
jgi:NAD(P)-dependent dehydrogenase (short-subunit alcohol dehydrogenase family)